MNLPRRPFKRNIEEVAIEDAHGGTGSRRLLLSKSDAISQHFHAMTKGYLPSKGIWDWHQHENVDEFFVVLEGTGTIEFRDGSKMSYGPQDLVYVPANTDHRIENTGEVNGQFYFVRLNS